MAIVKAEQLRTGQMFLDDNQWRRVEDIKTEKTSAGTVINIWAWKDKEMMIISLPKGEKVHRYCPRVLGRKITA